MEYKALPSFTKAVNGRTVEGIFAVHGNVDSGGDRSHPGLFGQFMADGRKRAVFLWQHDCDEPPIATIDRVYEMAAADLPPAVKLYAPDTTGGVAVVRTYLETPRGDEVLACLSSGAIREMSYAYEPTRWDFEETDKAAIRNLYEAELYDISDVNWGMNPATSADGTKRQPILSEHSAVLAAVRAYTDRCKAVTDLRAKEGRVLSGESRKRIEAAVEAMQNAHDALSELLAMTEPGKSAKRKTQDVYQEWIALQGRIQSLGVFQS